MDEVLITAIVFGFMFAVAKLIIDYRKDRTSSKDVSGSSLTTSELHTLIREAVEEAIAPRFDRLRDRLDKMEEPRLMPARQREEQEMEHPAAPPVERDRESMR